MVITRGGFCVALSAGLRATCGNQLAGRQATGEPRQLPDIARHSDKAADAVAIGLHRGAAQRLTEIAGFAGQAIFVSSFCVREIREGDQLVTKAERSECLWSSWW